MSAETGSTEALSLYELFMEVPDARCRRGVRHKLAVLLTLAATAILAGSKTLTAIAEFGRNRRRLAKAMGITYKKSPCISTFHYLFRRLNAQKFEALLQHWLRAHHGRALNDPLCHIDGKTLRGSRQGEVPGVHLVAAYSDKLGTALLQFPVDAKTNEHKAALRLLKVLPLQDVIVTGDAAFTQRDLTREILKRGGDYFISVKENQPKLAQAIRDAFDAPFSPCGESGAPTGPAHSHVA
jgi:hypothetical protein